MSSTSRARMKAVRQGAEPDLTWRHMTNAHALTSPSTPSSTRPTTGPDDDADDDFVSGYADEPDPEDDRVDPTSGAMELAERHQLRRVAGLRTELEDITEVEYRQLRLERVVLVGVWTEGSVAGRRELHGRARAARRDRRLRGARGDLPAPPDARPRDLHRPRQGRGPRRDRGRDRRRHRHLRRRARAQPAAQPRGPRQGQGRRPHRADPRHLRPARQVPRGPGAGRAGPAAVHEAAPARLGRQPVAPGRWPGRRRRRRHRWSWSR